MAKPIPPTPKQVNRLESWGLTAPSSRAAANSLFDYVDSGAETSTPTVENKLDKIENIKAEQNKWLGKRVRNRTRNREGVVRCIIAKNHSDLRYVKLVYNRKPNPFKAIVDWEEGVPGVTTEYVGNLLLLD